MFINNIETLAHTKLFYCDKKLSDELEHHGFSLLSIYDSSYVFVETKELLDYLQNRKKGGDNE
nr:MAG TPA: hypothetical protein [Caudoviricetes sp.]